MITHQNKRLVKISEETITALIAGAIWLVLVTGCGGTDSKSAQATVSTNTPITTLNPIKIACMQDKTKSTSWTRTAQVGPDAFAPLIGVLRRTGGELGFGLIRDDSNRSLLRLRIEVPPLAPSAPSQEGNPFEVAQRKAVYQDQLARHEEKFGQWRSETDQRIQAFLTDLKPLLNQPADATKTDIWGAVSRADLFLAESDTGWPQPTHRYAIFISDGLDDVGLSPVPMRSGAKVILVNASATVGALEALNPIRFESASAAFQFIVATEGGN